MSKGEALNYRWLFAKNAPEPQALAPPRRAKYDFAVAYPDPASVPLKGLVDGLEEALEEEGRNLAVYPHPEGYPPLREFVASKLARDRNIQVSVDDIILADGSSQPIHMLVEALVDPGDVVVTEDYVYSGTLRTLRRFQADVRGVPCDQEGMLPDALESTFQTAVAEDKRPKLVYTIPTFQNPQGWTMTLERRQDVLRLSEKYGVPIMEDDCYVDLRYEGEDVPAIRSLDDSGRVMYVGSFSKIIAPGVRMGYMVAPSEVLDRIPPIKGGGGVNEFAAMAVHRYATSGLSDHVDDMLDVQRTKRDAMLSALGENFGSAATWSQPEGGLYIWLKMPDGTDLEVCRDAAREAGVLYQTGLIFSPTGEGRNYARLCYGYNTPEEIREGIALLADVLAKQGVLTA